jgi:hypothetical protein
MVDRQLIRTCAPVSKMFRGAGGVLSVAIRRLCVARSEGFLQLPSSHSYPMECSLVLEYRN